MSTDQAVQEFSRRIDGVEVSGSYVLSDNTLIVTSAYGTRSVQLGPHESALARAVLVLGDLFLEPHIRPRRSRWRSYRG